jgi:hypothetical protein
MVVQQTFKKLMQDGKPAGRAAFVFYQIQ